MLKKFVGTCTVAILAVGISLASNAPSTDKLTAAEIVEKNVAARGGLAAWRSVKTVSMSGLMDAGPKQRPTLNLQQRKPGQFPEPKQVSSENVEQAQLPILLEMKRNHKSRIELQFKGQTALQVFDGASGYKVRPYLNRHEVEPFSPDELKAASRQAELDGPLVDYQAKGSKVALAGKEKVNDRDAYKLAVTTSDGNVQHIWIDAKTFLEVKVDGTPRRLDGKMHNVEIFYEDFRPATGGVIVPYRYVTVVEGVQRTEKIQLESVTINPPLEDNLFSRPE